MFNKRIKDSNDGVPANTSQDEIPCSPDTLVHPVDSSSTALSDKHTAGAARDAHASQMQASFEFCNLDLPHLTDCSSSRALFERETAAAARGGCGHRAEPPCPGPHSRSSWPRARALSRQPAHTSLHRCKKNKQTRITIKNVNGKEMMPFHTREREKRRL